MTSLPVKDTEYTFYIGLSDSSSPDEFLADPTIEEGDFQISIDGGALANLTNLPTVSPAGSVSIQVVLTATEMSGDKVTVIGIDQTSPNEWQDAIIAIDVPTGSAESVYDLDRGDRIETNESLIINKAGTTETILDKKITGSLLSNEVTITTEDT